MQTRAFFLILRFTQHFAHKMHQISRASKDINSAAAVPMEELAAACVGGDRKAQKALYDRLASKMFAVCLRYMGDRELAQDILQEGFVTLFSKIGSFEGKGSFEGWARRVFVTAALMDLRRKDALKMSDDIETAWDISSDATSQVQDIGYKELLALVASLPAGYRTVFNMYVIEGYSHKEIGQILGISEPTSRSQLQRARVMLQEKIRKANERKGYRKI